LGLVVASGLPPESVDENVYVGAVARAFDILGTSVTLPIRRLALNRDT
jgi:hypothetical protein